MPTYAPAPEFYKRLSHRGEVLYLYRQILRQAAAFFDERASAWMVNNARLGFRKQIEQRDPKRLHKKLSDARKALRTIERANHIDQKAVERILRLAYGMEGKERQRLLQPFVQTARVRTHSALALSEAIARSSPLSSSTPSTLSPLSSLPSTSPSCSTSPQPPPSPPQQQQSSTLASALLPHVLPPSPAEAPKPLHFQYERSIPPIYSPAMSTLIKGASHRKVRRPHILEPELPIQPYKPLHGKREANIRWRHFTKQIRRIHPPLPAAVVREIEFKSRLGLPKRFAKELTSTSPPPSPLHPTAKDTMASRHPYDENDVFPAEWAAWEHQLLDVVRTWRKQGEAQRESRWETGRHYPPSIGGKPARAHVLTLRFYRRVFARLLDNVPVLNTHWTDASSKASRKNSLSTGTDTSSSTLSPPLSSSTTPVFSVTRSQYAASAKQTVSGIKLQALVSEFDRLGLDSAKTNDEQGRKD
ncbi:hypothetical protein BGW41_005536 [Actinomortierella wolfii]|nr:hypothetical protein BGW41_005536 [Actinomortierella wolfii]